MCPETKLEHDQTMQKSETQVEKPQPAKLNLVFGNGKLLHFNMFCGGRGGSKMELTEIALDEAIKNYDKLCRLCLENDSRVEVSLEALTDLAETYKNTEAACLELIAKPTYENIKEAHSLISAGQAKADDHYHLYTWADESYRQLLALVSQKALENREPLEKQLSQNLGLPECDGSKIIVVHDEFETTFKNWLSPYEIYMVSALYGHVEQWPFFWVLPGSYEKTIKTKYRKFLSFTDADLETALTLYRDGGVYSDLLEAASAAVTL